MSVKFRMRPVVGAFIVALMGAAPAMAEPLRIGWANVGAFEPFFIAERNGWFEEAGLEVELIEASNPQQNIARLMAGELDVVGSGSTPVIAAIAQGVPIKIVMGNQNNSDEIPTSGLIVKADSPYQSVPDLAGKKIGTISLQGSAPFMVYRAFRDAGMPFDSAEMVNMPPPTFIENLQNGNVDAILPFAIFYDLASNNPEFRVISEPSKYVAGNPGIIYVASDAVIADKGDDLAKLIEVMTRAYEYSNAHPEEVRAIDAELTRLPPDYIANRPLTPTSITIDVDMLEGLAKDMAEFGFTESVPTVDQMLWEGMPR